MSKRIPEVIRELSRERAPQFFKISQKMSPPSTLAVGQIWSTHSLLEIPGVAAVTSDEPRLIVVLSIQEDSGSPYDQFTVAPISPMTWAATNFDLIVPTGESTLPYSCMVEVWNEAPVLRAHLRSYLGSLSDNAIRVLRTIHVSRLLDEALPEKVSAWVVEAVQYLARAATAALFADLPSPVAEPARKKRFQTQPVFSNVENFLKGSRRAFAASQPTMSDIVVSVASGEDSFVLQVLERRRESLIYALVHDVSPSLEGQSFVITVVLKEREIRSEPAIMRADEQVIIGNVSRFDKNNIVQVNIDFE